MSAFSFVPLDFVANSNGARHAFSACEFAEQRRLTPHSSSSGVSAPAQLVVAGGDQLTMIAASANLLERDADRRIGPAPAACPSTHLSACVTTAFPTVAALRSTGVLWHFLAVDSFLQARDDDGVAQFLAVEAPSPNGVRRGPILVYAVRQIMRSDKEPPLPAAPPSTAAAGVAPVPAGSSATTAATATATAAATAMSTAATIASTPSSDALASLLSPAASTSSGALLGGAAPTAAGAASSSLFRHAMFVHGARSRMDEQAVNWSADWEQIDLSFVPVGLLHIELPRALDADDAAAAAAKADSPLAGSVVAAADDEAAEPDGDSDTASQRSRGSTSSHSQRRRQRPNSSSVAGSATMAPGSLSASSGAHGRRCAILVLCGDGLIRTYAQTEVGMRFMEYASGAWWIAALRHAGAVTKCCEGSVAAAAAAAAAPPSVSSTTPVQSNSNTNTPTTPVASRPSSPRSVAAAAAVAATTTTSSYSGSLDTLFADAPADKEFFAAPGAGLVPASGGVPLSLHFAETHDADHYVFAIGFHSGLVRVVRAPAPTIEADFGDADGAAQADDAAQRLCFVRWLDGPIAAVRLFRDGADPAAATPLHLLVVSALGYAVVYDDVMARGLGTPQLLPRSDAFDALLCAEAIDANLDGRNELLIGTFSGHVLVYARAPGSTEWRLSDTRTFASAVHRIVPLNLLGGNEPNTTQQLAVCTNDGVQLMIAAPTQPKLKVSDE